MLNDNKDGQKLQQIKENQESGLRFLKIGVKVDSLTEQDLLEQA
jgi:hypothetical protein